MLNKFVEKAMIGRVVRAAVIQRGNHLVEDCYTVPYEDHPGAGA
jgi:hypothetical protein